MILLSVQKDGVSDIGYQPDMMHCLPDCVQNGFCKTALGHELKIDGIKKNGYCTSSKGNGAISNIMNGQCLAVGGSSHSEKNGFNKNRHWKVQGNDVMKNGYSKNGDHGVVRRFQKDNTASKGGSSVTKGDSVAADEQHLEQSPVSHVCEDVQLNHIKVSCGCVSRTNSDIKCCLMGSVYAVENICLKSATSTESFTHFQPKLRILFSVYC